jgi:hypothetical protein
MHQSCDPPHAHADIVQRIKTGRTGQPKFAIDKAWLASALQFRGPKGIAASLPVKISPRTVRKIALQHGLVVPGNPVFAQETLDDGSVSRIWQPRVQDFSDISDADLDTAVYDILQTFPNFGRAMITAELQRRTIRVQRRRMRESYVRVYGTPRVWGQRNIPRRPYSVPGPNSLWHHDGQHGLLLLCHHKVEGSYVTGLILYKIVIHGFVDGYSRLIVGLRARNNNRAVTVEATFHEARRRHGTPRRVRGDHGRENLRVAQWQFARHGLGTGAYIWGRSVLGCLLCSDCAHPQLQKHTQYPN